MKTAKEFEAAFIDALHEAVGICGHCMKRKCGGRKDHSLLPLRIHRDQLNAALKKANESEANANAKADEPTPPEPFSVKLQGEIPLAEFGWTGRILKTPKGDEILVKVVEKDGVPAAIRYRIFPV